MPAMNRTEGQSPAALRQTKPTFMNSSRQTEATASTEKKTANATPAPVGSIAAIESQLGF